jgi:hypothetical protein
MVTENMCLHQHPSLLFFKYFHSIAGKYWMDNLYCTGEEERISHCRFDGWGNHDCENQEAAGVVCKPNEETITTTESPVIVKKLKHGIKVSPNV